MVRSVLSDEWRKAPVPDSVKATLGLLEAMTRRPKSVGSAEIDAALEGGATAGALEQAMLMVALFSYMNRMVDAFAADVTPEQAERIATRLDTIGGGLGRLGRVKAWERLDGRVPQPLVGQLERIRTGDGDSPTALRTAIEAWVAGRSGAEREEPEPLPAEVGALAETLANDAHGVTDGHIDALKAAGWSEPAIYEMIFVASFAAGLGRMERAARLLKDL